ncbi:MAG: hypothetical protein PVJ40_09435 [Gammaproteobacteria bacterium]|jgi:hypothetical protein
MNHAKESFAYLWQDAMDLQTARKTRSRARTALMSLGIFSITLGVAVIGAGIYLTGI